MENLADKMLSYRAKNDLSQAEFAKMCKLTVQTICNVENGVQKPSKLTRQKILNIIQGA